LPNVEWIHKGYILFIGIRIHKQAPPDLFSITLTTMITNTSDWSI
jgi:hypothetical protein